MDWASTLIHVRWLPWTLVSLSCQRKLLSSFSLAPKHMPLPPAFSTVLAQYQESPGLLLCSRICGWHCWHPFGPLVSTAEAWGYLHLTFFVVGLVLSELLGGSCLSLPLSMATCP